MSLVLSPTIILGIETATPPQGFTQQEILSLLRDKVPLTKRSLALYEQFLLDAGIGRRYFAWDNFDQLLTESVDQKVGRFEQWAVRLGVEAFKKVLQQHAYEAQDIDALFVTTCTGYLCPGLSTYISQEMGLPADTYHLDLVGLGCAGALPGLRAADAYLHQHPEANVAVIAVEICSAAIHWDQKPELILSNAIFADGAAAVLLTKTKGVSGLRINRCSSLLWPQFRDELRFKYQDSRLCNVISPKVSGMVVKAIQTLCEQHPAGANCFAFHAGGRKILDAIGDHLGLTDAQLYPSRHVLKEYGNMSSPSVLFCLKEFLRQPLAAGQPIAAFAFGAGFSASMLQMTYQI